MKNKLPSLMTVFLVVTGIFAMPVTVSATGGDDTTPPELTAVIDGENLKVSATDDISGVEGIYVNDDWVTDSSATVPLKDYGDSQICVYAVDYAGNYSEVIILENPGYKESTSTIPSGALTPEGTGTIMDSVADEDKQFYTITSEAGNALYTCASTNPQKVTITSGGTASVSFHNKLNTGSIAIQKQTNTGENLGGWKIGLYMDSGCTNGVSGSPFTTANDGTIVVNGLQPGTYYAKELPTDDPYSVVYVSGGVAG